MTQKDSIKIGGASGYWGESAMATPQLLKAGGLDYIVYDYLAEITMSILARAHAKDPTKGYATDFVDFVCKPFLPQIAESGVKLIANAGGVNPQSCGEAVRALIADKGLDLKVAVITGDNLLADKEAISAAQPKDMFSGAGYPPVDKIASINAYLGAFPVAKALAAGADIIITGRVVDSAVTLGACIHEFGWSETDWDKLASGSLCGHILECGPQVTGGNFTDWKEAGDIVNIGYPIAEVSPDGSFITTKPEGTGGVVNVGTVSEQMLYEIGNPQAYYLPDVLCDFSEVKITQEGPDRVHVSPAKGRPAPQAYKTCLTYQEGFRAGTYMTLYGADADKKAAKLGDAIFTRAQNSLRMFNLGEYTELSQEIIGAGSQMGVAQSANEVVMKIAVKHPEAMACGIFLKEMAGMGLATPPGLSGFTGAGRARPQPVVRLFSYLTPKGSLTATIDMDGQSLTHQDKVFDEVATPALPAAPPTVSDATTNVPLSKLAWGRSGDKGNKANIGIIARKAEYLPYIRAALTPDRVREVYGHFMDGSDRLDIYDLPGSNAINILIDEALGGGGVASLRNDAQAKGYAQVLLAHSILVSKAIAEEVA